VDGSKFLKLKGNASFLVEEKYRQNNKGYMAIPYISTNLVDIS